LPAVRSSVEQIGAPDGAVFDFIRPKGKNHSVMRKTVREAQVRAKR
jgi:hypothetical protein